MILLIVLSVSVSLQPLCLVISAAVLSVDLVRTNVSKSTTKKAYYPALSVESVILSSLIWLLEKLLTA
jgi:hypothetical protein